jgi:hypothetical protein
MRSLLILAVIAFVLFMWSRSREPSTQTVRAPASQAHRGDSVQGGPVRQWEHEPSDMAAREGALSQPGSGAASRGVLDNVRQGLRNSGNR